MKSKKKAAANEGSRKKSKIAQFAEQASNHFFELIADDQNPLNRCGTLWKNKVVN